MEHRNKSMKEGGRIVVATASATFGLYGVHETMKIPCGTVAVAVGADRHDIVSGPEFQKRGTRK